MTTHWLDQELAHTSSGTFEDRKPALKLQENKITEFTVDVSQPFATWQDADNKTVKALIPVTHEGTPKIFWLNKRNPLYHQLLEKAKSGTTTFKVIQAGSQKNTRYTIVE